MVDNESGHQREATLSKTNERHPSVFVKDFGYIPLMVVNAAHVIEKNIRTKGLFQIKGTASTVTRKLMTRSKSSSLKDVNVHDAVEALKTFLVSLQDPLVADDVLEALISVPQKNRSSQYVFVLREFRKHSPYNFAILHFVVNLLSKVSKYALHNGADVHKLAVILVFDVIRPFIGEIWETRVNGGDLVQRLPFLIMVMQTLIENPAIFKMAVAVGDGLVPPETDQHEPELMLVATEPSEAGPVMCSSSCGSTYWEQPFGTEARKSSEMPTLDDAARVVVIQSGSQEEVDASTIVSPAETDTVNLKDAVLGIKSKIQCSPSLSPVPALAPFVNNGKGILVAGDSECSTSREGILKTSKCTSSPRKKPLRASRPKKAAITLRPQNRKVCDSKQCAREAVADRSSDSSLNSDFGISLLQAEISGSTEKTCGTESTNSLMAKPLGCQQALAVKAHAPKKVEDPEGCEHVLEVAFSSHHTSPAEQESGTSNRGCPLTLIPDSRKSVNTAEDRVAQTGSVTVNTDSTILRVPRKGVKCRRKGKVPLKKSHKRLVDLKSRSQVNRVRCFSISPLPLMNKDARMFLERISKTSSCVTFSPSTEDNQRTVSGSNTSGSTAANSDHCTDTGDRKTHHLSPENRAECETNTRHSAFASCSGCRVRYSAGSGASVRDNTRTSDNVSDSERTHSPNSAQSLVSEDGQEQSPGSKGEKGQRSPASIGNQARVIKKSSLVESPIYKAHTPKDLQQIIIVKVINDRSRAVPRARLRGTRNKSLAGAQQLQNVPQPERSLIASSLEDIFLMSITLFIISLVLYHLSNSSYEEDWRE